MKYGFNPKTGRYEEIRPNGIRVSGRIGGIMVEDYTNSRRFFIEYGTDIVNRCMNCSPNRLNLYSKNDAVKLASDIERIAKQHNIKTKYSDYRYFCSTSFGFDKGENKIKRFGEMNESAKDSNAYQTSLLINRLYTASKPYTMHLYHDNAWENVWKHIEALEKVKGVKGISTSAPNGGYHNYFAGQSTDINHPAYKEYMLEIDSDYGTIIGRLICHSAGTTDDAFSRYDMTCTFWEDRNGIRESISNLNTVDIGFDRALIAAAVFMDREKRYQFVKNMEYAVKSAFAKFLIKIGCSINGTSIDDSICTELDKVECDLSKRNFKIEYIG